MRTAAQKGRAPSAEGRITVCRLTATHRVTAHQVVEAVRMALGGRPCRNLCVAMVDDREISRLHGQFMADPTPTDVLAFDLRDKVDDEVIEGEIVLSAETAERQARCFRVDPGQELLRYAIHGTLHLIGWEDRTPAERRRMRKEEDRILAELAGRGPGIQRHRGAERRKLEESRRTGRRVQR